MNSTPDKPAAGLLVYILAEKINIKVEMIMKHFIFFVFITCSINLLVLAQSESISDPALKNFSRNAQFTFKVIDSDTREPIIGAEIISRDLNKPLAQTNIGGIAVIDKFLLGKFRIEYNGYHSFCSTLTDTTINGVLVSLKSMFVGYVTPVNDPVTDSIKKHAEADALTDIDAGKIQLYYNESPSEEQFEFSESYSFSFIDGSKKESVYISTYNEIVLEFLNNKYDESIEDKLSEICWYNWF